MYYLFTTKKEFKTNFLFLYSTLFLWIQFTAAEFAYNPDKMQYPVETTVVILLPAFPGKIKIQYLSAIANIIHILLTTCGAISINCKFMRKVMHNIFVLIIRCNKLFECCHIHVNHLRKFRQVLFNIFTTLSIWNIYPQFSTAIPYVKIGSSLNKICSASGFAKFCHHMLQT